MTERRRPLENDDGQGALFGGEAFAPTGPAPAWKRPARSDAGPPASRDAAPFQAGVDAEPEASTSGTDAGASQGLQAGGQRIEARQAQPRALEPGVDAPAPARDADAVGSAPSAPFADELVELERATEGEARRPRAPLAGPTLDDVMSRVWEGLVTGLPAACPVCHGEVVPAISGPPHGRCSSCGTTID